MNEHMDKADSSHADDTSDGVRTGTAAVVAAVWCEVFGVPQAGPDEDFFALGGHSMLAVRLSARLRTELGLRVPVRTILEHPTPHALARALTEAPESPTDASGG
ncbi:phosphopantetheine-binding protein [Streptomyces coelicoflavus]|uniref:phosphopantetheine-binding protein n=1 Tax=Streptomyces coelicoflavus TaxID=285562 RepID=UPI00364D0032